MQSMYAHRARGLDVVDHDADVFVIEALFTTVTNVNFDIESLFELVLECGKHNLRVMQMLDEGHVRRFGQPEPTTVYEGTKAGPGILVTGHDLADLSDLALLERVGLGDKAENYPSQLSGGQQQRVAIARALVNHPSIILADEPTANLDAANSHHILQTMENLNKELKTTFIFATHDDKVIQYLRRKISLEDGKVVNDESSGNGK